MGTDDDAARRLAAVLATSLPVLVDADGLTLIASHRELLPRAAPTLLTPHAGELGRLLGADPADVEERRLEHARRAATAFGACASQGLHDGGGAAGRRRPGAREHHGDAMARHRRDRRRPAGLAGALLAQGLLPPQAAIAAAYLHGLAARLRGRRRSWPDTGLTATGRAATTAGEAPPIGASDVIRALPRAVPPSMMSMDSHAEATVELSAISGNVEALRGHVAPAAVMAVVKADGYGHGAVPAAQRRCRRRRASGSAWSTWPRRSNFARRASTRRCCA